MGFSHIDFNFGQQYEKREYYIYIDKAFNIHIFATDFNSSFIIINLIKNGVGNRPVDTVAAGLDFSGCRVLIPAPPLAEEDEMKKFFIVTSSYHLKRFFVLNYSSEIFNNFGR